jgi:hypothetical protein
VAIYTYKHIVYITNARTGEEVTSWALPIKLDRVPIDQSMEEAHAVALEKLQADQSKWTSNTVIVVDTSGSMRNSDVWGTRTRLDAVWLALALDFVANRLETGNAGLFDVISVVSLGDQAEVLIREQPTSCLLYNRIVDIYENKRFLLVDTATTFRVSKSQRKFY